MTRRIPHGRKILVALIFAVVIVALETCARELEEETAAQQESGVLAPMFEVDPFWPQPLPNHWLLGSAVGISVDSRDHVWVIHRQTSLNPRTEAGAAADPPTGDCCVPAPNLLEFDPAGNLVGHWGGPGEGYDWPSSNHGVTIDHKDNVWIGGNGAEDAHILKFTRGGQFLTQFGKPGTSQGSNDTETFGQVAEVSIDAANNEVYVADGYGNRRVAVLDLDSGEFKRYWGAYGNPPEDVDLGPYDPEAPPAQQFRNPVHCAEPSQDGLVYVCDRANDRIQAFRADGTFVKEVFIAPKTLGDGSVWDIAFSKDPEQKYLYVADGKNMKVYILLRETLELLTSFGDGGRQPGQFFGVHSIATDSQGNIYTTETYEGKRVQKFVYKGLGPVTQEDQGTPWPRRME